MNSWTLPYHCIFDKMHGARNDFLFLEISNQEDSASLGLPITAWQTLAQELCDRRSGWGADGLVLWSRNTSSFGLRALILNSDGSVAATCGNALRCFGLLLHRKRLWSGNQSFDVFPLDLEPRASSEPLLPFATLFELAKEETRETVLGKDESEHMRSAKVTVGMGRERLPPQVLEIPLSARMALPHGVTLKAACFVQLANPHVVLVCDEEPEISIEAEDWLVPGRLWQQRLAGWTLPSGEKLPLANIGFLRGTAQSVAPYPLVVYERGAGLTPCCGSGAVAARVALEHIALQVHETAVEAISATSAFAMPGGTVYIGQLPSGERTLTGPAVWVGHFSGENLP